MNRAGSIRFLTRAQCGTCLESLSRIRRHATRLRVPVAVEDVDDAPDLAERFGHRVPVVLDRSGAVLAEGRLSWWAALAAVLRVRLGRGRSALED